MTEHTALLGTQRRQIKRALTDTTTFTIFMHLKTTPQWLALAPTDRFGFLGDVLIPILQRHEGVALRYFDAEFFTATVSDVAMWETRSLSEYQALVEDLRKPRSGTATSPSSRSSPRGERLRQPLRRRRLLVREHLNPSGTT